MSLETELPRQVYVESTNRCNSKCRTCVRTFRDYEPRRDFTPEEFRSLMDQFPTVERVVLHGLGEPLLNPHLPEMIRYVKKHHPEATVLFNSNAILLDEGWRQALIAAGLDEYRVSLDAATAGTYAFIRGVDAFRSGRRKPARLHSHHRRRPSPTTIALVHCNPGEPQRIACPGYSGLGAGHTGGLRPAAGTDRAWPGKRGAGAVRSAQGRRGSHPGRSRGPRSGVWFVIQGVRIDHPG